MRCGLPWTHSEVQVRFSSLFLQVVGQLVPHSWYSLPLGHSNSSVSNAIMCVHEVKIIMFVMWIEANNKGS